MCGSLRLAHDSNSKARERAKKVLLSDVLAHDSNSKACERAMKVLLSDELAHDSKWNMHP